MSGHPKFGLNSGRLLSLFLLALVVDVGGAFGIKYGISVLILAWVLYHRALLSGLASPFRLELFLFGFAPLLLAVVSIAFRSIHPVTVLQHSLFLGTWLLLPVTLRLSVEELSERYLQVLCLGAGIVIATFVLQGALAASGQSDWIFAIRRFFVQNRMGLIGPRPVEFLEIGYIPGVYYRWTMLLIPATVLSLGSHLSRRALLIVAVLLTLSTGVIVFTLAGLILAALLSDRQTLRRVTAVLLIVFLVAGIAAAAGYSPLLGWITSKFSPEQRGAERKLAQVENIARLVTQDGTTLMVGMGVGSTFYSEFLQQQVVGVEVSQADMIRQFGLPYSLAFFLYVGWLALRLIRVGGRALLWGSGLLAFFCATATNPLLLSPVFFAVLVLARALLHVSTEKSELSGLTESR